MEYSACNFTNKLKLVGTFQRLCKKIYNTRFDEFLLVAASENSFKISSFDSFWFTTVVFLKHLIL